MVKKLEKWFLWTTMYKIQLICDKIAEIDGTTTRIIEQGDNYFILEVEDDEVLHFKFSTDKSKLGSTRVIKIEKI